MEETIIALLLASDTIRSVCGTRVFPGLRDQGSALPALVFTKPSGLEDITHEGPSGLTDNRIQIDAYGETYAQAKEAARAVKAVLLAYAGTPEGGVQIQGIFPLGEQDLPPDGDEPTPIHRVSMDFNIWAGEPA